MYFKLHILIVILQYLAASSVNFGTVTNFLGCPVCLYKCEIKFYEIVEIRASPSFNVHSADNLSFLPNPVETSIKYSETETAMKDEKKKKVRKDILFD